MALSTLLALAAAQLVTLASSPLNDYNPSLDRAERRLVFARSEADFQNAKISVSERQGRRWTDPRPITFSDARYSDSDPWLTPDGKTLYFVSNRPTSSRPDKRDLDIWRSSLRDGAWSAPEHLGNAVNSAGPELGPEVRDGTLYFASVRKGGKGGLDIYAAPLTDGAPGPVTPVDGPFNSAESDSDFTISADGRLAAFWRGSGAEGRIFVSRRAASGWGEPQPLSATTNHGPFNFTPAVSADGKHLWYASTAAREGQEPGMADIYRTPLP